MRVEVLYFEGCPHHRPAVERTREVIAELGVAAELREVQVRDAQEAARLRFLGSPSVRVDGLDVVPDIEAHAEPGLSCRWYGGSGIPTREAIAAAIASAESRASSGRHRLAAALAVPAAGLAALPACPACYPLYAGILASLGLTPLLDPGKQAVLTGALLAIALFALAFQTLARRAYGPLALGVAGAALLVAAKFLLAATVLAYAGAALLVAATLWNAWKRGRAPRCEACAPGDAAAERLVTGTRAS